MTDTGEYKQAQTSLTDCLALAPEAENPESFAIAHGLLAEIAWQLGNSEQALAYLDRAAQAFKSVRRQFTVARFCIILRATILLEQNQISAATAVLDELWPLLGEAGRNPIVFESHLLQAKITAANVNQAESQQQMVHLLAEDLRPAERAAATFELWQLDKDTEHGRQSLAHYQQLAAQSPRLLYHHRLNTLATALHGNPTANTLLNN